MKIEVHTSDSRGVAQFEGIAIRHTFSYQNYYNKDRIAFGGLRVLNDYTLAPGKSLKKKALQNMEIVCIVLSGALSYKDSMANEEVLKDGSVHAISTGKGLSIIIGNHNATKEVKFLELWVFPAKNNVAPCQYFDVLPAEIIENEFVAICEPGTDEKERCKNLNAWMYMLYLSPNGKQRYKAKDKKNGVYVFVITGKVRLENWELRKQDGCAITKPDTINIMAEETAQLLIIEVPLRPKKE